MKNFSMPRARITLRQVIQGVEPPALDYIDWQVFEDELDACLKTQPTAAQVKRVFAKAVTRARQKYHAAIATGTRWKQ